MNNHTLLFYFRLLKYFVLFAGPCFLLIITYSKSDVFKNKLKWYYAILEKRRKSTLLFLILMAAYSLITLVWVYGHSESAGNSATWPSAEKRKMREACIAEMMQKQNKSEVAAIKLCDCINEKIFERHSFGDEKGFIKLPKDKKIQIINLLTFECEIEMAGQRWSDSIIQSRR